MMFSFSRVAAAFTLALSLSSAVYGIGQIARGIAYQEQACYAFLPGASAPNPSAPFSEPTTYLHRPSCQRNCMSA
ncbi:hypothetical protein F5148DRAFT_1209294, partial [Russula earlei]